MNRKIGIALGLAGILLLTACGGKTDEGAAAASTESAAASSAEESAASSAAEASESTSSAESTESETEETPAEAATNAETEALMALPLVADGFALEDCITLADYKNLDVAVDIEEVTDEDVQSYMESFLEPVEIEDESRALAEGDIANIDFVGKKDGEPFSGGTGTDYDLEIGSGTFIPGFEEGMIGMKKGEERDLDLTFPEEYQSEELAGQAVVFTVTLNAIKEMPELDDAWVKEYTEGEFETVDAFRTSNRTELETQNKEYAEYTAMAEAWQQLIDNSEYKALPESYVQESADQFDDYVKTEAETYGYEDAEAYLQELGMDQTAYESYRDSSARNEAKSRLLVEAMTKAENLKEDDPDCVESFTELAEMYGLSVDELKEEYGEDMLNEYVFTQVLMERVLAYNTK